MSDPSNNPEHYTQGTMETWDAIVALGLDYLEGNIVKYISRYKHKGGVEDLEKARAYLERLIQREQSAVEAGEHVRTLTKTGGQELR